MKSNSLKIITLSAIFLIFLSFIIVRQIKKERIQDVTKELQIRLDSLSSNKVVPGVTLAVRYKNGANISLASGLSDIENGIPMQKDGLMLAGSVGKTYVAAVVLKLYERGMINLNARAVDYLEEMPWFNKIRNSSEITVEMLLNHTAGIPEYVYEKELWQEMKQNPDKVWSVEERLSYIFDVPPVNAPGEGWSYADSHYLILGLIIEKVTGSTYYEILNELVLTPYKLSNTIPSDKRFLPGLVAGYTNLTEEFLLPHKVTFDNKYAFNPQLEWTGGGLASTVSDLTLWISQLYGGDVLKPETKNLMLNPAPFKTTLFENAGYGLGTFIGETDGITYYGHTGFSPGYITYVQYLPEYNLALAFQFNDDSSHENFSMKKYFNTIKNTVLANYSEN